jgi:addiction module RelE/StbE family toxin
MARKIIWSEQAASDKDNILHYWLDRNGSKSYPLKLNKLFHQAAKLLAHRPLIGRKTSIEGVRSKLVRDYLIFYKHTDKTLEILFIWSGKMNPADSPFQL